MKSGRKLVLPLQVGEKSFFLPFLRFFVIYLRFFFFFFFFPTLSDALQRTTRLQIFNLSYNNIKSDGAKVLFNALSNNRTITWLNVSKNSIGDSGAEYICGFIGVRFSLFLFLSPSSSYLPLFSFSSLFSLFVIYLFNHFFLSFFLSFDSVPSHCKLSF
jgi:hypothetical protein